MRKTDKGTWGLFMTGTLTRAELAESISREVGLSRLDAAVMIKAIIDNVSAALETGENVKIPKFGTFLLRDKRPRMGRNPKTLIEVPITPRRVIIFRPSRTLRDVVA